MKAFYMGRGSSNYSVCPCCCYRTDSDEILSIYNIEYVKRPVHNSIYVAKKNVSTWLAR